MCRNLGYCCACHGAHVRCAAMMSSEGLCVEACTIHQLQNHHFPPARSISLTTLTITAARIDHQRCIDSHQQAAHAQCSNYPSPLNHFQPPLAPFSIQTQPLRIMHRHCHHFPSMCYHFAPPLQFTVFLFCRCLQSGSRLRKITCCIDEFLKVLKYDSYCADSL